MIAGTQSALFSRSYVPITACSDTTSSGRTSSDEDHA